MTRKEYEYIKTYKIQSFKNNIWDVYERPSTEKENIWVRITMRSDCVYNSASIVSYSKFVFVVVYQTNDGKGYAIVTPSCTKYIRYRDLELYEAKCTKQDLKFRGEMIDACYNFIMSIRCKECADMLRNDIVDIGKRIGIYDGGIKSKKDAFFCSKELHRIILDRLEKYEEEQFAAEYLEEMKRDAYIMAQM